jgi:uncharacterized protein (DUF362 family)
VKRWTNTDLDFTINYVFIDKKAFRVSLKHKLSWSIKEAHVVIKEPKITTKTVTILIDIGFFRGCLPINKKKERKKERKKKKKVMVSRAFCVQI